MSKAFIREKELKILYYFSFREDPSSNMITCNLKVGQPRHHKYRVTTNAQTLKKGAVINFN